VHEHWNNAVDKQYSRNLGISDGIELVTVRPTGPYDPGSQTPADLTGDGAVNAHDLVMLVQAWLVDSDDQHWNPLCDLSADGHIDFDDLASIIKNLGPVMSRRLLPKRNMMIERILTTTGLSTRPTSSYWWSIGSGVHL